MLDIKRKLFPSIIARFAGYIFKLLYLKEFCVLKKKLRMSFTKLFQVAKYAV